MGIGAPTLGQRSGSRVPALGPAVVLGGLALAVAVRAVADGAWTPQVRLWATIVVSISVQALPFLVLGVVVSGALASFVDPGALRRLLPSRPALAVPAAGVAGLALPGCECGSVPIAGRLISAGTAPAAALTFLLAAPAINPVVLVSTAVAFPGDGWIVPARFVASLGTAVLVGWWWTRRHGSETVTVAGDDLDHHDGHDHDGHDHHDHDHDGRACAVDTSAPSRLSWRRRVVRFTDVASRDLVHAGGYLVVGAVVAATLQIVVPQEVIGSAAGNEVTAVLVMATLAVLLSVCSEADAFVAAGMPQFSLTSRLVFLVVGPVVDLKLVAMQSGVFGVRFARVFAPVTFLVAVTTAVVVGQVLL
jgi:uncharacterized membrane protein YraQ (UPF0718 family)